MGELECPGFARARRANFQFAAVFFSFLLSAKMKLKRLGMSTILFQPGRERYAKQFGRFTALEFFIVRSKNSIK